MDSTKLIFTRGKLLLTGEYFVLSGALALAIPSKYGQHFELTTSEQKQHLHWESLDYQNKVWFKGSFDREGLAYISGTDEPTGLRLQQILQTIANLSDHPEAIQQLTKVRSTLDFPNEWGLGTSSTLIAALARWSELDPYQLLEATFGGSGYDLACALSDRPLFYQKRDGKGHAVHFPYRPSFQNELYLVYLGQKQNSREGIKRYRAQVDPRQKDLDYVSQLSLDFANAQSLSSLEHIIQAHENFVAQHLQLPKAKDLYFPDYWGTIKSLGAWGGDFVLATSNRSQDETLAYFNKKGKDTVIQFGEFLPKAKL